MNRRRIASRLGLGALLLGSILGTGCAQERDPISRVQANAMSKHFFVGADLQKPDDDPEFFWRNYVVDASASQSLIGVGSWGHVDRIRWEITEDMLIGRKAYQISDGEDNKGVPQSDPNGQAQKDQGNDKGYTKTPNGTIVAAYKITSHFDIKRSYNPQTGEELNIVEENASDRPWQQREYMRVDWSQNLVGADNPMWGDLFTAKTFGKFSINPLQYYVDDPSSDDSIHIDEQTGYLDVTNKFTVTPEMSDSPFSDYTAQVPTCLLVGMYTGSSTYECDPQEATVRSSYMRIDPNEDFEPLENTKASLDVVGNPGGVGDSREVGVVSAGRQGWDPQYGYTDALYHRFAYIHNIWDKSHQAAACTANDDANKDGTADQCDNGTTGYQGSTGSQCDVIVKKCTVPLRDRQLKTVGYWVNKEAPDALQDTVGGDGKPTNRGALEDLIYSWNQLLEVSVATSREVECRRTGSGSRDDCHAQFFDSTSDPATKQMVSYGGWLIEKPKEQHNVLTFCHNPVRDYDDATCGKPGDKARVGDIRKNFVFYWPYESRAPWGGIADWNADPLTGRIIGGAAQIMGRSATYAAAMQRDIIQLALGDTQLSDIIQGAPSLTYQRMLQNGRAPAEPLSSSEIASRVNATDFDHLRQSTGATPYAGTTASARALAAMKESMTQVADPREVSTAMLEYDALANKVRGTQYEAQMVDSHWLSDAIGASPGAPATDVALSSASPLRGLDPVRRSMMQDIATEGLRNRGVCFMDSEAPAMGSVYLPSLAGFFKAKYGNLSAKDRGEAIYQDLWKESVKGIALHEIGHSLGLLHQFASSWDAPNYNPQYWQLRTNEGASAASCNGEGRSGDQDSCMGPRYIDPETSDEQGLGSESRPGILYFANTSTMEYQLERGGETVGLGTYDQHAMKALYGRVLETFDDRVIPVGGQQAFRFKNWSQLQDRDLIGTNPQFAHYTETARAMKVFDAKRDCRAATDEEKAHAGWRIVHGKVCSPAPKDHWAWQDFKSDSLLGSDPNFNAPYWHVVEKDGKERVRWPYRYGTTHNAYFHTNDSDAGADAYEVAVNTAKKFDLGYPWGYFRRQNREYYYRSLPSATSDRYLERMRSYHWLAATDLARVSNPSQLQDDNDLRPVAMAQKEMFGMLARAVLMPEPGDYYSPDASPDVAARQPVDTLSPVFDVGTSGASPLGGKASFSLGVAEGRYIGEEFDNDMGGSWDYLKFIKHAGFSVEKGLAMQALVDGRPTLYTISRENFLDGRAVKINFRNDLPDAIDRLVGGILAEDWESVGMSAPASSGDAPTLIDLTVRGASPTRPGDAKVLFPNVGYKQELSGVVFAALFSRLNTDMTLVNKMRLWIDGQVGAITVPDAQQVRFQDPASSYTYIARKYGADLINGKSVDKGIASRMLAHANAITAVAYQTDTDKDGKMLTDAYGAPKLTLDKDGHPIVKDATRAAELTQYVGLLDALRQIGNSLGYGPLSGTGGED